MSFDFDKVLEIKGMHSSKWDFMAKIDNRARETTLPFWLADMDFPCADVILDAVKARADRKILCYSGFESDDYTNAVTGWYAQSFNWEIDKASIRFSSGLVAALCGLINIFTKKGDGVIIQRPVYPAFARAIENNGRTIANNALINTNGCYTMDFDDLEEKCKHNKLLILCSPHNPAGRVWTRDELAAVLDVCTRNGVIIVADEIHCDLTRLGVTHHSLASVAGKNKSMVVSCVAPSKTFNIAGLAHSHVIIDSPEIRRRWDEYASSIGMCSPNPLSLSAAKAAYTGGGEWLLAVRGYIDENLEFMAAFLKQELPGIGFVKPEGTYLTWLNTGNYGACDEVFGLLLEKADVMVQKGTDFGPEGEGFVRLNAACPRKLLTDGLTRIADALR